MSKLYQYTIYRQDGSIEKLEPGKKREWPGKDGLYELIGCTTIQEVPKVYFPKGLNKRGHAWCDEEGLFNSKLQRNPNFVAFDGSYIVGNVVLEEVFYDER